MKLAIALLASIFVSGAAHAAPPELKLNSPNSYDIQTHSQGCFHNETSSLTIKNGVMLTDDNRSQPLTKDILAGLNLYFYALDLEPAGGCTTTTRYTIRETTPEGDVSEWKLVDGTCMMSFPGSADERIPKGTDWSRMLTLSQVAYASDLLMENKPDAFTPTATALQEKIEGLQTEKRERAARITAMINSERKD